LTSAIEPLRQIGAKRNESGSLASQSRDKLAQELRLAAESAQLAELCELI
jgi:hypothetical protein